MSFAFPSGLTRTSVTFSKEQEVGLMLMVWAFPSILAGYNWACVFAPTPTSQTSMV